MTATPEQVSAAREWIANHPRSDWLSNGVSHDELVMCMAAYAAEVAAAAVEREREAHEVTRRGYAEHRERAQAKLAAEVARRERDERERDALRKALVVARDRIFASLAYAHHVGDLGADYPHEGTIDLVQRNLAVITATDALDSTDRSMHGWELLAGERLSALAAGEVKP